MNSVVSISLFCFALFFSGVISGRPMKLQVEGRDHCTVTVSGSSRKRFNTSLENGIKVFFFQVHYNWKPANYLTRSIRDDHFANPNEYMWLYDGEQGLPIYMNAPYDFDLLSMFILREYTESLPVYMNVSKSCNEKNVSRVNFLRLVFQQLIKIVADARLPDKKSSSYICYDINNSKKLQDFSFKSYQRLGINREILLRYCCPMRNIPSKHHSKSDLCDGKTISSSRTLDLQNYVGAFLLAFFPLVMGFISSARLPWTHTRFDYIRSISNHFDKGEQFELPFGTESSWISERDNTYNINSFLKWLFLFRHPSLKASRIRRSMTVFSSLLVLVITLLLHFFKMKKRMKIYLDDNIPMGYISLIFGYEKSCENSGCFLGGPLFWFLSFITLALIVINIPDRLCETIAYSFLHQPQTCTFLIQDISLLKRYGGLNLSNLHDYNLLYTILKASLMTSLNPSFWAAIIKQWFRRCRNVYACFNNSRILYQLIGVSVTILCVLICSFLCLIELLLSVIFYGLPILLVWKAIPHSYIWRFIWPLFKRRNTAKIVGFLLLLISFPVFIFLFIFNIYLFLTSFQLLSAYVIYTLIALIAKPDAIAYVLLTLVFFYFVVAIVNSVSETYQSLLKVSIKLADSVCAAFVYTRLDENFIYSELFERIVEQHHPVRYEVAKAVTKLLLALCLFISCLYSFHDISLNLSTYIKITLIILTTMIPKIMTVLNETVLESQWKIERLLETIYDYSKNHLNPNDIN